MRNFRITPDGLVSEYDVDTVPTTIVNDEGAEITTDGPLTMDEATATDAELADKIMSDDGVLCVQVSYTDGTHLRVERDDA